MSDSNDSIEVTLDELLDDYIKTLRSSIEISKEIPERLLASISIVLDLWIDLQVITEPWPSFKTSLELGVCTIGNQPFESKDLDQLIKRWGFPVHGQRISSGIVIFGRTLESSLSKTKLDSFIKKISEESDGKLRIYSQEMFMFSMLSGLDIYEENGCSLEVTNHILNHPLLKIIENDYFEWPDTFAKPDKRHQIFIDSSQIGVLGVLGYRVGRNGKNKNERHYILNYVYESDLSFLNGIIGSNDLNQWSTAKSAQRLAKMAYVIANLAKNAKKKTSDYSVAISEWEADLDWLKVNYYDGVYDKKAAWYWPST